MVSTSMCLADHTYNMFTLPLNAHGKMIERQEIADNVQIFHLCRPVLF